MATQGDLLVGRYRLRDRLGQGGAGDVFRAHDTVLGREVAVKLVRGPDQAALERVAGEARMVAGLSHPNLVTVHDTVREGPIAGVVMELLDGGSLAERLQAGPLPVDEATRIGTQVARGLQAAHEAGLVHRDVKPANVLLATDGTAKVADFGIAGIVDATTVTTTVRGSVPYLAPEQARGETTTPRTDVYALGCLLYELLVGTPPYRGDTTAATVGMHMQAPIPRPAARRPGVPAEVDDLVVAMLAKDPEHRPADMATVAAVLSGALPGLGPSTDPADVPTRPVQSAAAAAVPHGGDTRALPLETQTVAVTPQPTTRRPWVIPAILALVAVALIVWQWPRGGPGEPSTAVTPTGAPTAAPTQPDAPTTAPEDAPTSVEDAVVGFRRTLNTLRDDGQASGKAVEELDEHATKVLERLRDDDAREVAKQVRELGRKIDELERNDELTAAAATDLGRAADQMQDLAGGVPEEDDEDEGD